MTESANNLTEAFVIFPVILDRIVDTTGPALISFGGEAPLFYFGLALLSAQLWRIYQALRDRLESPAPSKSRKAQFVLLLSGLVFLSLEIAPVKKASNPAITSAHTVEASFHVPAEVESILREACKDCHSHETRWPWYANVAPVSWVVARDVERGRRAMNLSEWSTQPGAKPALAQGFLIAACADVESGRMPPASYKRMHRSARLNSEQTRTLCDWTSNQARVLRSQANLHRKTVNP